MSTQSKTNWHILGELFCSCNCAWGCPCQFNAPPTHGNCQAFDGLEIREGYFGDTHLDGLLLAFIYTWPGPVHEGHGTRQLIIDEQATPAQRAAAIELVSGAHRGPYFETYGATCPHQPDPIFAPISLRIDRERRQAALSIPGIGESRAEPIRNPVTGEEHRARIVLPNGWEYKEAEMANAVTLRVESGNLTFQHANCYAQLNAVDWSSV